MKLLQVSANESKRLKNDRSTDDSDSDDNDDKIIDPDVLDSVYKRYDFNRVLPDLPIVEMKDVILKKIKQNPVIILEGDTGCGKTTQVRWIRVHLFSQIFYILNVSKQVPQFILDDAYEKSKPVNIVVTQPRRIAAVSIAKRVSKERGLAELPNIIGYQVNKRY